MGDLAAGHQGSASLETLGVALDVVADRPGLCEWILRGLGYRHGVCEVSVEQQHCLTCHVVRPWWAFLPDGGRGSCAQCRLYRYSVQDVLVILARQRQTLAALCEASAVSAAEPRGRGDCAADFEDWIEGWREGWKDGARSLAAAIRGSC